MAYARRYRYRAAPGFTLLELCVSLAVVAVLSTLGIPDMRHLIALYRVDCASRELLGSILLARSEAIHRRARVDVVPNDGVNWASGWQTRRLPARGTAPDSLIIDSHAALAAGIAIESVLTDRSRPYVAFTATGRSRTDASAQTPQAGHIVFRAGPHERRIVLNFAGRPRLCRPVRDADCD
ncbi:MAG: GspH/FimT family pseudopilin [Pseudomonadota bacterium]|nr:GspH/FimT family pseudopilin [Pseudomonadota bacterium]